MWKKDRYKDPPTSKLNLKGVSYQPQCPKNPYKAYIRHHGQYITLGYYKTKLEAAKAYNLRAYKQYGPEAYFNPLIP